MPYGSSQRPFNKWCGLNFPNVECLREEQKDCIKKMVNDFGNSLIFQLFPQIMSLMNVTEGLHLHDHGGLHSFRGHKEWSRWPVKQNRSCSNNSMYWQRTESARGCVKWINGPPWFLRFVTFAPFAFYFWYLYLLLHRVWPLCDLPCNVQYFV